MNGFPWLTALWLLPLAGAVTAAALPARRKTAARWLALVVGSATLAIAVLLAVRFEPAASGTSSSNPIRGYRRSEPATSWDWTVSRWRWCC